MTKHDNNSANPSGPDHKRLGDYEVLKPLGKGGMGYVYLARDPALDRLVAIKVLRRRLAGDESLVARFRQEARAAAKLNHPNIVQVYAVREDRGTPFIVMEFVEGITLEQRLGSRARPDWVESLAVTRQIADALACAHSNGIVHRDVKPSNVILASDGRVRVSDFGLAKFLMAESKLTTEGAFLGTPQYMSPEHCGVGEIGPHSDLFSLGVMLYEMIAGRRPFAAETPVGLVQSITTADPPPLKEFDPAIPDGLQELVMDLLRKEPERRPATGRALLARIDQVRVAAVKTQSNTGLAAAAKTTPVVVRRPWYSGRRGWTAGFVAILLLALVLAATNRGLKGYPTVRNEQPALIHDEMLRGLAFVQQASGVIVLNQHSPACFLKPLGWNAASDTLYVEALGLPGGHYARRRLVLAVSPGHKSVNEAVQLLDARSVQNRRLQAIRPEYVSVFPAPAGSPLYQAIVEVRHTFDRDLLSAGSSVLMSRDGDSDEPKEVYASTLRGSGSEPHGICTAIAGSHDGKRLAMVLTSPQSRTSIIAELNLDSGSLRTLGRVNGVVRDIRFAPTDEFCIYFVISNEGSEIRAMGAAPTFRGESPLAIIPVEFAEFALSPEGDAIVASWAADRVTQPRINFIQLDSDPVYLGDGCVGPQPWHPSGNYFVAAMTAGENVEDLFAVWPDKSRDKIRLTRLHNQRRNPQPNERQESSGPIVSPDGKWVGASLVDGDPSAIVFVNLEAAVPRN
ncbi:MAG: hypothetical protein AMXMBFR84_00810 [Candidatus Hydrogenedentota bacterium]